jgi:alpha-tubulin suppressor-like RCC1 family protein
MAGVSCGAYHTLATTKGGDAWSWGEVRYGALGIKGETGNQFRPMRVEFAASVTDKVSVMQAVAGRHHSLFLDVYGRVYSCGDNEHGQLGMSVRPSELLPSLIPNFNDVA